MTETKTIPTDLKLSPVQTKAEVFERLRAYKTVLFGLGVRRCGVFGSFVRGEMTPESDVDVLITFEPTLKTFNNFMDLAFFLEDLMGRDVDVLTPEYLSPIFGHRILAEVEDVPLS
jgi:predicted nucleotidyltransferase